MKKICGILFALTIITAYLFSSDESSYLITWAAYAVYMLAAVFYLCLHKGKFIIDRELMLYAAFAVFSTISLSWAKYEHNRSVLFLFLMLVFMLISRSVFTDRDDLLFLIDANIIAGVLLSVYTPLEYGLADYIDAMMDGMRMGREVGGENTVGICTAMSAVMSYGMFWVRRKKRYLLYLIPLLFTCFSTGSRTSLITLIIGVIIATYFCNEDGGKKLKALLKTLFYASLIIFGGYLLLKNVEVFHRMFERFDGLWQVFMGNEANTEGFGENGVRNMMIREGLKEFLGSPIWGIGYENGSYLLGYLLNQETYSLHNNFVDILCGEGLIGFSLFYGIYVSLLIKLFRRQKQGERVSAIAICMIILNLFGHMSGVFYPLKFFYPWMIVWILAANIPLSKKETKEQEVEPENRKTLSGDDVEEEDDDSL